MELGEASRDSTGFAAMEEGLISRSGRNLRVLPEWSSGFPYFLQFKSEFGNKEFMI